MEVPPGTVQCCGTAGTPHAPTELAVGRGGTLAACPVCGRQFRAAGIPDRIGPAAWPRDD